MSPSLGRGDYQAPVLVDVMRSGVYEAGLAGW